MDTYGDRKPEFIPCATRQFTYDAENHLVNTASVTYTYDGDGKRVQKSNGTLYWYGTSSEPIAETNASGNTTNEYIFFGGKRVALVAAGTSPVYYVQDILGTSRVITNSAGSICYDADYYPYGIRLSNAPKLPSFIFNTLHTLLNSQCYPSPFFC